MKKLTTILFALLYITLTSGFTVNVHYCMGKFASVNFTSQADDVCNQCSKPGKKGKCCKDEYKYCKVDVSSHEVTANVQYASTPAVKDLRLPVIIVPVPPVTVTHFTAYYHHGPPEQGQIPLYVQYCTYLI
jgi:hypothetical protein